HRNAAGPFHGWDDGAGHNTDDSVRGTHSARGDSLRFTRGGLPQSWKDDMAVEAGADGARPLGTVVEGRGISTVGKVGGIFFSDNAERSDDDDVMGDEDAGDGDNSTGGGAGGGGASGTEGDGHDEPGQMQEQEMMLRVELRPLAASIVVVVRQLDPAQVPYVVENVDPTHRVYFRQKGAEWCPWQSVGPGEKRGYVWEEPILPPRLLVRVGPDALRGGDLHRGDGGSAPSVAAAHLQAWGVGRVSSEETG
ncbi:unnamed protein product, partial [Laminaria digitata]